MTTTEVIAIFIKQVDEKKQEISLSEMKKILTEVYKKTISTKPKKKTIKKIEIIEEPKKKTLSEYIIFMYLKLEEIQNEYSCLKGQKIATIAQMWNDM